ncbi:methylated-DNA--[protein]-cysteine S-methyltransferase [Loktanella sp. R86503]|uniref:methylated-DNA--[protein]-cysteine S-methyltransferase n=1 Tax=Loktanella sp. R86503 TaxID=3093847 RepID=UPI0036DF1163
MEHAPYHYDVMARAIALIDKRAGTPMPLDELAHALGMSASHVQRVFTTWVGVSPKRYQQFLALDYARDLLRRNFTTLDTAADVGLSGSSRLHDLFVRWEAMTPGEFARRGEGLSIYWGWFDSPFGQVLSMATDRGLCGLAFAAESGRDSAMADLTSRWPAATYIEAADKISAWTMAALQGTGEARVLMIGTPLQIQVWEALLRIPSGHVTTYSEIAKSIGRDKAVRAVGTAVGRNPVSLLIPCHRALRKSGALGGYHWGLPVKRTLLAWESAREHQVGHQRNIA